MNVAFLVYNRPDHTQRVFSRIREAKPDNLFVIADAPRRLADKEPCKRVLDIVGSVDWPCKAEYNVAASNMGMRRRTTSGLDWVLSQVDRCVFIEDDCLPEVSFFDFCESALQRYRVVPEVGMISGNNHGNFQKRADYSCHFSRHQGTWGWATWADRWALYSEDFRVGDTLLDSTIRRSSSVIAFRRLWGRMVRAAILGDIETWDVFWSLSLRCHDLLTLRPMRNAVANIGEMSGENCSSCVMPDVYKRSYPISGALRFPRDLRVDHYADRHYARSWAKEMSEPFELVRWLRSVWWRTGSRAVHRLTMR